MTPINILIVDDRQENIIALEALLENNDLKIFSTTSPNEALRLAWENEMSIALVDVQMPEMDGFEFVEMLKSNPRTKDILIIFVTAISKETKYAVKGLSTGAVDYLYKPLDPSITLAKVNSFIQLARYQADIKQKNVDLQNLSLVVKNSADIICAVDTQRLNIETINPAVEKIMGYKPADLVGKCILDFAVEDERFAFKTKLEEIVRDSLTSSVFEFRFNTFNGKVIWAECRAACLNKAIFINISDISPQKSYEEQLIRSKENAEHGKKVKETFLANMSHELRTPVNGIIGLTALLRKTELNEQQNSMIDLLEVSSQSLLGVINDVLDISKMEAGKFNIIRSPNNVHDLIRSVYGLLKFKADENNIEFLMDIASDVPEYLMIDSLRLNQILMNLISNAIKFTKRGYVKLTLAVLQKKNDQVQLKFTIEDSGIGIPAKRLTSIFESFEQAEKDTAAKYGGTGLGLAIVKRLAELKDGDITVASEPGKGSTFAFTNWYKITDKPKEKNTIKTEQALKHFESVSILVAEDNLVNQFMLSKVLKDWEMDVDIVDNGRKVIDKLHFKNYSLILMDTHMPELNGYETARAIRRDFDEPKRSIPIISLSAASFDYEQQEAINVGMNDVLSKPFLPHELHKKIDRLLNGNLAVKIPV
jgi:PAS domain S-box-containing protein